MIIAILLGQINKAIEKNINILHAGLARGVQGWIMVRGHGGLRALVVQHYVQVYFDNQAQAVEQAVLYIMAKAFVKSANGSW